MAASMCYKKGTELEYADNVQACQIDDLYLIPCSNVMKMRIVVSQLCKK